MTTGFSFASTALAGLSNVLGGTADTPPAGTSPLPGLFSGLVDANGITAPAPTGTTANSDFFTNLAATGTPPTSAPDLSTLLAGPQTGSATDPLAQLQSLLQNAGVQLADSTGTAATPLSNPTASTQILAQSLQQIQQAAAQLGISMQDLAQPANLKAVLQKLGVPGDKIDSLTTIIQSSLSKATDILGSDDSQMSALAQLMIAIHVAPFLSGADGQPLVKADQPVSFTLTAASATDTSTSQSTIARAQNALKQATSYSTASDAAREVAGLKTTDGSKVKTSDSIDDTTPQVAAPIPDAALPAVAVAIDASGATLKPVVKAPVMSDNTSIISSANVQAIDNSQVLAPVSGDVKFTWNGEDSAKPVTTTTDKLAGDTKTNVGPDLTLSAHADLLAQTAQQGTNASATANAAQQADFAQQVEQFQQKLDLAKRYDVTNQTVVQMKSLIDQGGGEIRIKLNPPELGQVHVELTVKDGTVSGKISASDPAVVNALAGDIKQFGDGLKQAGFKLGQEGLSFMLNQQNPQQQQQSQQQQQAQNNSGFQGGDTLADDEAVQATNPAAWVAPDRLLDVNI
jgi:flagellar hook-length control protein FliK